MQFHHIQPTHRPRRPRRIGRGGKRGTYSGRGIKGQKARAGAKVRPAVRDFVKSVPKLSGEEFPALPKRKPAKVINLLDIKRTFANGASVTPKTLVAAGLLPSSNMTVKLLGKGESPKGLLVKGIAVSKSARKKIESAGGAVES